MFKPPEPDSGRRAFIKQFVSACCSRPAPTSDVGVRERGEGQGEISPKNSLIESLNHTVLGMAGFAGQSNVKSKTDDCCSLSSGERVRVRAVVKTHFKFLSYLYDAIRFQVHGEVKVHGEGATF
jgi:hypothetical protein